MKNINPKDLPIVDLTENVKFPRYNLKQREVYSDYVDNCDSSLEIGEIHYTVELAISGWRIEDIYISLEDNILTVEGKVRKHIQELTKRREDEDSTSRYSTLFQGLSFKPFVKKWHCKGDLKLEQAYSRQDGLLYVVLVKDLTNNKKQTVDIVKRDISGL